MTLLTTATRPEVRTRPGLVLAAALLGFFMMALDSTALNVAVPEIGRDLGGATSGLQWVMDGYTLMFAALLISAGALADRLGPDRTFAWGLAAFMLASAASGVAPAMWFLIVARLVQGSAAALAMPASLALVRQAYSDPAARAKAIARWTMGGAVAIVAGPVAGGVLTSAVTWRAIFFLNLPTGIVALLLLRAGGARGPHKALITTALDLPGQVSAVLGLAALTFGIIEDSWPVIGLGIVAGIAFLLAERRAPVPMVPLGLLRERVVAICVAVGFVVNAAFYGVVFVLSLFFQRALGLSALEAGLLFLPMSALVSSANFASAKAAARFGPRLPIWTGQFVAALGMLALTCTTDRYLLAVLLIPVGVGLGFAIPSMTATLLEALPASKAGLAAGLLNSGRQAGGTVAVAVLGRLVARSFSPGLRDSLLILAALLTVTAVAATRLPGSAEPAASRRCSAASS
jgi:DHA2 family methylenomycin A resistance protein-like MFS transporter